MKNQVNFLLEKLYDIDKDLGGKAKEQKRKKKGGEFDYLKSEIQGKVYLVTKKQNERDEKQDKFGLKDQDVIRLNMEIRDLQREMEKDLTQMNSQLNKMSKNKKKFPEEVLMIKDQMYQNLVGQVNQVTERETDGFYDAENPPIQTLNEAKQQLFAQGNRQADKNQRSNAEGVELEAIREFERRDKEMDVKLDRIIDGTHALKYKAKLMGEKIEEAQMLEKKLNQMVQKTTNTAISQNAQLKKILTHYRKPNKFCMDMTLFCLFLGLIAVIYNMVK